MRSMRLRYTSVGDLIALMFFSDKILQSIYRTTHFVQFFYQRENRENQANQNVMLICMLEIAE